MIDEKEKEKKKENVNYKHEKKKRKIRQSYHTKFTRIENASAIGNISSVLTIKEHVEKKTFFLKRKKKHQQQQLVNVSL